MSTSHVAALSAIDAISVVKGVSGLRFVSDPKLDRQSVHDIGYDHAIDYETILKIKPDLLVAYAVNGAEPPYVSKLSSLGVRTLILHDHLEDHPLARAEYVRLFGALTGRQNVADSVFAEVRDRYLGLAGNVDRNDPVKVLINIPYSDAWFIPGKEGYMSRLVEDAGGVILGAPAGTSVSGIVSLEKAYGYSLEADMWLNPGSCRSRDELVQAHHMFSRFGPVANGLPIYNNIRCADDDGGNDFWERGAVRPDLILQDLIAIFNSVRGITKEDSPEENLLFYVRL
jgi:iron complex transport system substrate-binding protein